MNIALYTVLCLLGITAIHWFCDFVMQSRFEAGNIGFKKTLEKDESPKTLAR